MAMAVERLRLSHIGELLTSAAKGRAAKDAYDNARGPAPGVSAAPFG